MGNIYHFSLHLQFKKDIDVDKLENKLGFVAYRKNVLSESKGMNKTAKLWFKSKDYEDADTYTYLHSYIETLKDKFEFINEVMNAYDGTANLTLYFEEVKEKPYIRLDVEDMKILADNNISFDVDFRM